MYLKVRVFPKANHDQLVQKDDNKFEVHTKARAEDNKANRSAQEMLAQFFNVSDKNIRLIAGHHRPNKIFEILP